MPKPYAPESLAQSNVQAVVSEKGGLFGPSAARVSPTQELADTVKGTVNELACSKYLLPSDTTRMKENLSSALSNLTRADGSPMFESAAKLQQATDNLYTKLSKEVTEYNKVAQPGAFDRLTGAAREMNEQKANHCAPVLAKQAEIRSRDY